MTPELTLLREKLEELEDLVGFLELELVDDPRWPEPSDTSYLKDKDKADPSIMSNVEAMSATNELVSWFGRDMEGFLGLWRGPKNTPLESAPVVRLDSEGQYELLGATLGDYLASADEENFDENRELLADAGFEVSATQKAIRESLEPFDSPNDYRHVLYNEARARRGLAAVES